MVFVDVKHHVYLFGSVTLHFTGAEFLVGRSENDRENRVFRSMQRNPAVGVQRLINRVFGSRQRKSG